MSAENIINDVVVTVATSNGTGSQSANLILMRTIFNMGIPVAGKNMFPSNIQGLPTWFTVRANEAGWSARKRVTDLFVAMNVESIADDIAALEPGASLVLDSALRAHLTRDDLDVYSVPFEELCSAVCKEPKLRKMVVNIVYVGVVAFLLELEMEEVKGAIRRQFARKEKAALLNIEAAVAGYDWAAKNLERRLKHRVKRSDKTKGKIIIEGNVAGAMGLCFGGLTVAAWYPITPSSSLAENLIDFLDEFRRDEDGKATFAVIQGEDELASMAMVVGAGWAGARAATATSGPGISLMAELAGLCYFAEIPVVIVDVQRMGPSTGLPTRTCQGDILKAYLLSHGDCKHPLVIPGNVRECYELAAEALNLAEELQTLVFLMLDLDLGMNSWMSDPFPPLKGEIRRGKVMDRAALEKAGEFARYKDVDGDGIPYRTIPGTDHPLAAYFTRGTGHTERATYSEKPADWKNNIDRLERKFDTARTKMPRPVVLTMDGAEIGILAYGSSDPAVQEARDILGRQGIKTDYLRLRALPIDKDVEDFIAKHRVTYVVEQNRDAQCAQILRLEVPAAIAGKVVSVLHYSGLPLDAMTVVEQIVAHEPGGLS